MSDAASDAESADPQGVLERYRGIIGGALGIAVLGYLAYAVWSGWQETAGELGAFQWWIYAPVLGLTLVNYGLRYGKWAFLLRKLGVTMPTRGNLWTFLAGLGMVISPGKAGELVKPWLVKEITGTPMARTIPALVTERLTDGIAVVMLAAVSVRTFYPESTTLIVGTLVAIGAGLAVLSVEAWMVGILNVLDRVGALRSVVARLREAYAALRVCLSPVSLLVTLAASLVAWWAECVGYWLVFLGLGVDHATLEASTFLYAFATVFGAPSPGGMGMADIALVEGADVVVGDVGTAKALAAALLVRVATLWFGVLMGAVALLRMDAVVSDARAELGVAEGSDGAEADAG